jgi:hypothetical protein
MRRKILIQLGEGGIPLKEKEGFKMEDGEIYLTNGFDKKERVEDILRERNEFISYVR